MKPALLVGVFGVTCITLSYVGLPQLTSVEYDPNSSGYTSTTTPLVLKQELSYKDASYVVTDIPLPTAVKAIYMR